MVSTYLAVIILALSGNSVLRKAGKVPLLIKSRISGFLASIILEKSAFGTLSLMITVNQSRDGQMKQVSECSISLM